MLFILWATYERQKDQKKIFNTLTLNSFHRRSTGWSKSLCAPTKLFLIVRYTKTLWSPCITERSIIFVFNGDFFISQRYIAKLCKCLEMLRFFTWSKIYIETFWVMTPCRLVDSGRHFGGTYCFHLQGREHHGVKAIHAHEISVNCQIIITHGVKHRPQYEICLWFLYFGNYEPIT